MLWEAVGTTAIAYALVVLLVIAVGMAFYLNRRLTSLREIERAKIISEAEQAASAMVVSEMRKTVAYLTSKLEQAEARIAALERQLGIRRDQ